MIGFHLSKQFTPFIFISKRLEVGLKIIRMDEVLVKSWLEKLDNEPYLIKNISQIIPDNYFQVFDTFNRFRKLDSFQSFAINIDGLNKKPLENGEDIKDQLIQSYKIRLEESLLRAEKAESFHRQMLKEYQSQSSKLLELQLELDQNILMVQDSIYQKANDIVKEHFLKERIKLQELENSKHKTFELQTRLLNKEVTERKMNELKSSIDTMKKEQCVMTLKMEKLLNINTNQMINIQEQNKANEKLQFDNKTLQERYLEIEIERNQIQSQLQQKNN